MTTVFTIGHSTHPLDAFLDLLRGAGIRRLVDVRTAPGSKRHPHFARHALAGSLPEAGIAYEWWGEDLGGWRKPRPDSRHTALRNESFRGYADHMETDPFRRALERLVSASEEAPTAIMCSEAVWWRCHRSMVADALVAGGHEVRHVMPDGSLSDHRLRDPARVEDGRPVYDAGS